MHVLLQPTGSSDANKHFVDTILNPVPIDTLLRLTPPPHAERLRSLFQDRTSVPTWGVTPGERGLNVPKWERIQAGDLALFSRDGKVFASSFVADKVHAPDLARYLWQTNADGETWEYIYFVDDLSSLDLPYRDFNKIAGYKENNVIQPAFAR